MDFPDILPQEVNLLDPFGENGDAWLDAALYFDKAYYLHVNPDLAAAKRDQPSFDLWRHFLEYGLAEGRPSSLAFEPGYVRHHIARVFREEAPQRALLSHFLALPAARKFVPNRWFSPYAFRALYAAEFPELAGLTDFGLFEFYLRRHALLALSPCGTFNEARYRRLAPTVAAAVGRGEIASGFAHFTRFAAEAPPNLPASRDRAAEAAWLLAGQPGLGQLVWWFDEEFYRSVYPDVHELVRREKVKSALEHYLVAGWREGRTPSVAAFDALPGPQDDPWEHFAALAPASAKRGFRDICAAQAALRADSRAASPRQIADALWPFVVPPEPGGFFDEQHYLAVNIDVARAIGDAPGAAEAHWRSLGRQEHRVALGTNLFGDRIISFEDVLHWRSGVNFFGPVSSSSGLGTAARGYAAALRAAGLLVDVYDISALVNGTLPGDIFCDEDLRYSINYFCINADLVQSFVNRYGTALFNHRANVGAWVWELPAPRPEWRACLSAFDLIICPSKFCAEAFSLSTDRPVSVVPYVVDAESLQRRVEENATNYWIERILAEKKAGRRIVLFIMDASSYQERKGVDLFIALAERVSKSDPDRFCFVLKTHSRDISLAHGAEHRQTVLTVDAMFSFAELCRLKSVVDLYVSPHRSEGFGLNIIESLLLGVPVLCSDYAGATELLAANAPPLVPVRLREIGREMGPYRAEAVWAEPDMEAMAEALTAYFAGPRPQEALMKQARSLRDSLSAGAVGALLRDELTRFCALGAERAADKLQAFRPLAGLPHDECYRLGYAQESGRRSPDAPGLDRLGEIAMTAMNPFFSIITVTRDTAPAALETLYEDLLNQSYPAWEWCITDDGSDSKETLAVLRALRRRDGRIKLRLGPPTGYAAAVNRAVAASQCRYLVMLGEASRPVGSMLASYVEHLRRHDAQGVLYCDEQVEGSCAAVGQKVLKPDFAPELLLSMNYIGRAFAVRKAAFLELGGYRAELEGAEAHDFLLRAWAANVPIQHIDQILHLAPPAPPAPEGARRAVTAFLAAEGYAAEVEPGLLPGTLRVRPRVRAGQVALNILTGCTPHHARREEQLPEDEAWRRSYAAHFVASILAHAPALDFTIRVIADEAALPLAAPLAKLDERVEVVPFRRKSDWFNFAEKANFALSSAVADRLVLLNDDMEAMDSEWLPALLEMLELPHVGIVGGELLYENGTVQHAGVALGPYGATVHLFEGAELDYIAPNGYNKVIRNSSAVTGALLAMHRSTFELVGGFDERFPVDYNDIDFCLQAAEAGLRTVYTPYARLRHFESRSAIRLAVDDLDRARFCRRWAKYIQRDPYYNRHLSRTGGMWEPAD